MKRVKVKAVHLFLLQDPGETQREKLPVQSRTQESQLQDHKRKNISRENKQDSHQKEQKKRATLGKRIEIRRTLKKVRKPETLPLKEGCPSHRPARKKRREENKRPGKKIKEGKISYPN